MDFYLKRRSQMNKILKVEIEIEVDENIDSTDVKENIDNIGYLSEKPVKVVKVEFDRWAE